jgi:hypothetical protein
VIIQGGAEVVEDIALTDIFKDESGAIKVRARVTGARFPISVEWLTFMPGPASVLLYPGDNELTIGTPSFNGSGGDCSLNYSVRLDPHNRYTETNETNNNLDKTIFYLDRNGKLSVRDHPWLDVALRIPCDTTMRSIAFDFVLHYCGTEAFNTYGLIREVRQSGKRPSTSGGLYDEAFDQSINYRVLVTDNCDHWGSGERELNAVASGQCVFVRILLNALTPVDSDVTLYVNDTVASWPGIRNPITLHLDYGKKDGWTGECRFGE